MPPLAMLIFVALLFPSLSLAQKCAVEGHFAGQNLAIADISGSTPTRYPDNARRPQPSTAAAWKCIRLPEHRALQAGTYPNNIDQLNISSQRHMGEDDIPAIDSASLKKARAFGFIADRQASPLPCKPNALLFARGTIPDWGTMGSVGDALSRALAMRPGQAENWYFEDVKYWNDGGGFSCYGLSGGRVALDQLNALGSRCIDTKIVVGGAMVARIAVANVAPNIKERVAAVVTFGDPFVGALIRGFDQSGLRVSCANGDNICNACFNRKPGNHSGYTQSEWVEPAVDFILEKSRQRT